MCIACHKSVKHDPNLFVIHNWLHNIMSHKQACACKNGEIDVKTTNSER